MQASILAPGRTFGHAFLAPRRAFGHTGGHFGDRARIWALGRVFWLPGARLSTRAGILAPGARLGTRAGILAPKRAFRHVGGHFGAQARVWARGRVFWRLGRPFGHVDRHFGARVPVWSCWVDTKLPKMQINVF